MKYFSDFSISYWRGDLYEYQVAEVVVDGILDRGEMSAEALECLAQALLRLRRNAGVAA
jgi:hypothetical protein